MAAAGGGAPNVFLDVFLLDNSRVAVAVAQDAVVADVVAGALRALGCGARALAVLRGCAALVAWRGEPELPAPLPALEHVQDVFAAAGGAALRLVLVLRLVTPGVLGLAERDAALGALLFCGAAYAVMRGRLAPDHATAVALGALVLRMRDAPPRVGELRARAALEQVLPAATVARFAPEALEEELLAAYAAVGALPRAAAAARYCALLEEHPMFGVDAVFHATQRFSRDFPAQVLLGVSCDGVAVFDTPRDDAPRGAPGRALHRVPLAALVAWSTLPPSADVGADGALALDVRDEPAPPRRAWFGRRATPDDAPKPDRAVRRWIFATPHAPRLCETLNDLAAQMLREIMEEEKLRKDDGAAVVEVAGAE